MLAYWKKMWLQKLAMPANWLDLMSNVTRIKKENPMNKTFQNLQHFYTICWVCTLSWENHQYGVFTQAWGFIVITSYFCFLFFSTHHKFLNYVYYNCMTYILTTQGNKRCKIKLTLNLFYQAKSLFNYMKVEWLWWYKTNYLFLMRVQNIPMGSAMFSN